MKHFPTKIFAISATSLILAGAGFYYFTFMQKTSDTGTQTATKATVNDRPVGEVDFGKPTSDQENPTLDKNSPQNTSTSQSDGSPIPITITYAAGSPLQIRVIIEEIISNGTCTLTLKKSDTTELSETADVFPTSSSTTCKGFTVDASSIPKGTYTANVNVQSGNRSGSDSKVVVIQ